MAAFFKRRFANPVGFLTGQSSGTTLRGLATNQQRMLEEARAEFAQRE
jgi:hypothetical protein